MKQKKLAEILVDLCSADQCFLSCGGEVGFFSYFLASVSHLRFTSERGFRLDQLKSLTHSALRQ